MKKAAAKKQKGIEETLKAIEPAADVMKAVMENVESTHSEKLGNSTQLLALSKLRDTHHPKLISGKLRIEDAEKMAGKRRHELGIGLEEL